MDKDKKDYEIYPASNCERGAIRVREVYLRDTRKTLKAIAADKIDISFIPLNAARAFNNLYKNFNYRDDMVKVASQYPREIAIFNETWSDLIKVMSERIMFNENDEKKEIKVMDSVETIETISSIPKPH